MPHIHTGPGEHDLTASAIIIRRFDYEKRVLMHIHKKTGRMMQPGGHVELTEAPYEAILREIKEETGYVRSQLTPLQRCSMDRRLHACPNQTDIQPFWVNTHTVSNDVLHYHTDLTYVFLVESDPEGTPDEDESQEHYWLNVNQVTLNYDIPSNVRMIAYKALISS